LDASSTWTQSVVSKTFNDQLNVDVSGPVEHGNRGLTSVARDWNGVVTITAGYYSLCPIIFDPVDSITHINA